MAIELPNGSRYSIVYLDTNVVSEVVRDTSTVARNFVTRFTPDQFVPAFSVYSVIELRRAPAVWEAFCRFFGAYPHFITKAFQDILSCEVASGGRAPVRRTIAHAFSPLAGQSVQEFMAALFCDPKVALVESEWRRREAETRDLWISRRDVIATTGKSPNTRDAKAYVAAASIDTVAQLHPDYALRCVHAENSDSMLALPSMLAMLHSQYQRLFDAARPFTTQDVTDVEISAFVPYADAVVVEAYQAEVLRKTARIVGGLPEQVLTLRDLR